MCISLELGQTLVVPRIMTIIPPVKSKISLVLPT